MRMPKNERYTNTKETRKNAAARRCDSVPPVCEVSFTANSTANKPKRVVNLMTGLRATEEVSLKGSPTVSPMTVAS